MRNVLIILGTFHLSKNLTQLGWFQGSHIGYSLFLELNKNLIVYFGWNFRAFFGLKLCQPFIEMIDLLIGIITYFTGRILVGWFIAIN